MTVPKLAVDMSNHGGELTLIEANCLKRSRVETAIIGIGPGVYGAFSAEQIETARQGKVEVEAYTFLEFGQTPEQWVDAAIESVGPNIKTVKRWWLDCEDTRAQYFPPELSTRIAYIQRAFDRFMEHGIFAHMCTGRWFWKGYMGNVTVFAEQGRLLFNMSDYDNNPDINDADYGGWSRDTVAIEQSTGTVTICGQSVDTDTIYIEAEESDMASTFVPREEFEALKVRLFAGSERGEITAAQRKAIADDALANPETKQSISDVAASAIVVALKGGGAITDDMSDDEVRAIINTELQKAKVVIPQ